MRLIVNVKVYSFTGFPADPPSRFQFFSAQTHKFTVDHIENLSFIMESDSTVLDLKTRLSIRRNVPADRQHLIQPLTQDLQKDGSGPEHFRSGDISEFANSDKFSDFNTWNDELLVLLVDEFIRPHH